MAKRSRPNMQSMVHEDRLGNLPDDILISIVSRLTLQEATWTCILSTRWRHLHTYASHLNFPKYRDRIDTPSNYVNMIDHVMNTHRGTQIKELVVDTSILGCDNFERWFKFAITKRAEIIRLSGQLHNDGQFLRLPITNGIECIKDLYLGRIKMTGGDFELLISNCLALECLRIEAPISLNNVSIVGHSKLKHVGLSYLCGVESIVIRDVVNLISLTIYYLRNGCAVQLSNIPKLTELDFQESIDQLMLAELLARIPSCIRDQLQLLRLLTSVGSYQSLMDVDHRELVWVDLVKLKHLELVIDINKYRSCWSFSHHVCRLIEACGSLEKLVIKFMHKWRKKMGKDQPVMCERCREVMDIDQSSECEECEDLNFKEMGENHAECELSVKYLEIIGYSGYSLQRKLALYVVNNAIALQKLTVVSCDQEALARARHDFRHTPFVHYDTEEVLVF